MKLSLISDQYPFSFHFFSVSPGSSVYNISGDFDIAGQAHAQLETHITLVRPNGPCFEVVCSTQCMDHVQDVIARVLKVPNNT